jgi:hypothetical protein
MEKQVVKSNDSSEKESQLLKIALDQVYVAHHPTDIKYAPLFRKGQRVIDTSRHLYRRAVTRRRILTSLTKEKQTCTWISKDQYERLPVSEWTIQDEERIFGGSITRQGMKEVKKRLKEATSDSRFALAPEHNALLQMAQQIDTQLDHQGDRARDDEDGDRENKLQATMAKSAPATFQKDESESSSSTSDDEDDDGDEPDPMLRFHAQPNAPADRAHISLNPVLGDSSDNSDTDDSSSDDDDNEPAKAMTQTSDGSSSTTTHSSEDGEEKTEEIREEEVDDFLVDAHSDEDENVFSMTLKQVPALGEARGDKTKGWETQKQRPGQFKKRRVRR